MNKHQVHTYTAFGYAPSLPSRRTLLGFNGQHSDVLTGLYILGSGYRGYAPELARFISPDDLSPFDHGGINSYCYCGNDPINNTDPSGHFSVRSIIPRRQQQPLLRTRSQVLIQLDSPAQVNAPSRRDAPPYFSSQPDAFSTSGTPPTYTPGVLPGYSKQLPAGHQRIITPTVSASGELVLPSNPPSYTQFQSQPKVGELLPPAQEQTYRARLAKLENGRYERLIQVTRQLERNGMDVPESYRRDINELRREQNRIRDLLGDR